MKMMRKNWKDRKGVSPVIATILMVAITVVLAAVLYVMVMGFGGDNGGQAPAFSVTNDAANKRMTISISPATNIDSFMVKIGDASPVAMTDSGTVGTAPNATVTYVDAGKDEKVNSGDYFKYTTGSVETTVDILWVNGDTNQVVATFTIPKTVPSA